jgi:hypothetical protein
MKFNMKYRPQKITDRELLEIFPEAKEILPAKIKEWEATLKKDKGKIKDCLAFVYSQKVDEFSIWFLEQVTRLFLMPPILEANGHILRLKRMLSIFSPAGEKLERWQEKVEIARHYPITELARSKLELRPAGRNFIAICPFHSEKHASFYIYPETNSFYCFGCGTGGDNLKLTMHLHGVDFKEAVRMLQN